MKFYTTALFCLLLTAFSGLLFAQSESYDVRLVTQKVDCDKQKAYVDIEIKAVEGFPGFHLASQNYRFTIDTKVVDNPELSKELSVSGMVEDGENSSFYAPHSLMGSKGSLISYNVVLMGGPGVMVTQDSWVSIGRLVFDIKDIAKPFEAVWHQQRNEEFPKTIVICKEQERLSRLVEGGYFHENTSFKPFCSSAADDRAAIFPMPAPKSSIRLRP